MSKEKEILSMHFKGYSQREICAALKCGHTTVSKLIAEARRTGLTREATNEIKDADIVRMLTPPSKKPIANHAEPDFERLVKELEKPDVTRKLLWYEYCTDISDTGLVPYQYSQFCNLFVEHLRMNKVTYRIQP